MRKVLVASLVVISAIFILHAQGVIGEEQKEDDFYQEIELFTDALVMIRSDYVEEAKYKDLIYGALKGMLRSLDDYSQFLTPEAYNEVKVETEGEFGGLGIQIAIKDGLLTIIAPIDDTPAYHIGLKANDKIVKIEDEVTKDITLMEAVKKLRGEPGTEVTITVMREGAEKLLDFTITRDIIKVKSIRKAKLFEDNIGYVRLSEFQERSPQDLEKALRELEAAGLDSLILDLRNNPGGLLDSAVKVSEKFIPAGEVIVSTRGRAGGQDFEFRSGGRGAHREYPLVVMISGGSASGSEIVAGAIKDHKRGVLLGTKTFGKGSVQTVVPLMDGSALRLTTSKYYTPSGICIHEKGIEPDVEVKFKEESLEEALKVEEEEAGKIFEKVEEEQQEKKAKEEKTKPQTGQVRTTLKGFMEEQGFYDNQLVHAVDLLKGIKVYRGEN